MRTLVPASTALLLLMISFLAHAQTQPNSVEALLRANKIDQAIKETKNIPNKYITNPITRNGNNLLHEVIRLSGRLPIDKTKILIKTIIEKGGDLNRGNNLNEPSFFYIPKQLPGSFLDFLISEGADLNRVDNSGNNLTHYLVKTRNDQLLQQLQHKIDLDKPNNKLETPLMHAAKAHRNNIFNFLLQAGANYQAKDAYENSVAHHAAMSGGLENFITLLEKGIPIDIENARGETPISIYASKRQWANVRKLIELGAKVDVPMKRQENLLLYLKLHPELGMGDLIDGKQQAVNTESKEFGKALIDTLIKTNVKGLEALINMGWDVNEKLPSRDNAIFWVLQQRTEQKPESLDALKLLVENGAEINLLRKNTQTTPLIYALINDDQPKADYLLSKGADKSLGSISRELFMLINDRRYQQALTLLDYGISIDFNDQNLWFTIEKLCRRIETDGEQGNPQANQVLKSIFSRRPKIDSDFRYIRVVSNIVDKMRSSESIDVLNSGFLVDIEIPQPQTQAKSAPVKPVYTAKAKAKPAQTLSPLKLSNGSKLHVVGVYEGESKDTQPWWAKCGSMNQLECHKKFARAHKRENVTVRLLDNKYPVVLSLMAYEPVNWQIINSKGAKIEAVILSGYYGQTVNGLQANTPVNSYTYKPADCDNCMQYPNYFYAYKRPSKEFDKAMSTLLTLTGKQPSSFQGRYKGKSFSIMHRE